MALQEEIRIDFFGQFGPPQTINWPPPKHSARSALGDLQRSRGQLSLWQPSYNSKSTGPIATISTPVGSAYAISSTVLKLVTLSDLCGLQRSRVIFGIRLLIRNFTSKVKCRVKCQGRVSCPLWQLATGKVSVSPSFDL